MSSFIQVVPNLLCKNARTQLAGCVCGWKEL